MISRSLELPDGFQSFDYYRPEVENDYGVILNPTHKQIRRLLTGGPDLYLYTQHEIFFQDDLLKQTRTSPNWEGGVVTYSTCKHNMRTYKRSSWRDVWIGGLTPSHCANNCLLFLGRVDTVLSSNYKLGRHLRELDVPAYKAKRANNNPRGDIYTPVGSLAWKIREGVPNAEYNHKFFSEPPGHTRSVEYYKKSAGSSSDREDGLIPKWWRDIEYLQRGIRPPSFILRPCFIFSKPMFWTAYQPRRAVLRLTPDSLFSSLRADY